MPIVLTPITTPTDPQHYAYRADLELKWGAKMVTRLADPDGSKNSTDITNRIEAALSYADDRIDQVVAVPDPAPAVVKHVAVALASGWMNGRNDEPVEADDTGKLMMSELKWAESMLTQWGTVGLVDEDPTDTIAPGTGSISVVTRCRSWS